ncbi:MAG: hypothetical protein CL586_02490 [Alteromonadaceae bacterium]|nr:hypothetical protein [Alteromonadaceae bacterium]|tara:strand:+ start:809 stop:1363 length:555 start_codon:yes stop_codon:yes gene_type:complete
MDIEAIAKIGAPVLTAIVGFILKSYFEAKPKLVTYLVHSTEIPLHDGNNTKVNTHSIVVSNTGKKTANNIRIGHNLLPKSFQLFPQLTHEVTRGDNDSAEILIPTLVPGERVSISYLYWPPVVWGQIHSYCKCDETNAKYLNVAPTQQLTQFQNGILLLLMFIGATTIVYWLFLLVWAWISTTV